MSKVFGILSSIILISVGILSVAAALKQIGYEMVFYGMLVAIWVQLVSIRYAIEDAQGK